MNQNLDSFYITIATLDDYKAIAHLSTSNDILFFGEKKQKNYTEEMFFDRYITYRFLIYRSESNPYPIGYAEVTNYPNIPALPEDCWSDWINHHYCLKLNLHSGNTYFFNNFVYYKCFNPGLLRQVLREIFYREHGVLYVIVLEYPNYGFIAKEDTPDYRCLEPFSTIYYPLCFSVNSCPNTQKVYVICRDNLIPQMTYRKALPEDNDDIVELIDIDWPATKENLGEYYIAEELLSEKSSSLIIVTEIFHQTAGFIWLNGDIDIPSLIENFDLELFGNIIAPFDRKQKFKEKILTLTSAQRTPANKLFTNQRAAEILESMKPEMSSEKSVSSLNKHEKSSEETDAEQRLKAFYKMDKLMETFESYDYYIKLTKQNFVVLYNVDEEHKSFDDHPNAFAIQLFGLTNPHDIRRLYRYICASFMAFPDIDYCLMSVPVTKPLTEGLFEMLKYFIPVMSRPGRTITDNLFITHRSTIYGDLMLLPVRPEDVDAIKHMISDKPDKPDMAEAYRAHEGRRSTIVSRMSVLVTAGAFSHNCERIRDQAEYDQANVEAILKDIFNNPFSNYKCFTIRCGDFTRSVDENVMVGFVILRPFHCSWQLKKNFLLTCLYETRTLNTAEVLILKLHPIFHWQADSVFRELARLTNCWHFYYFQPTLKPCLSNDLIASMQPLEPRHIRKLWFFKRFTANNKFCFPNKMETIPKIDYSKDLFAAFQHNLGPSIYYGNAKKIVILGFTNICMAFLRLIIFNWNEINNETISNTNCLPHILITVICKSGVMEAEYEKSFRCESCNAYENCWANYSNSDAFIRDVTKRMNVRTWVRFVSGKVESIDTASRFVKLEAGCEVYYEYLLLMCSTYYGLPTGLMPTECSPSNYVQINNRFDKLTFFHRLKAFNSEMPKSVDKSIVIYGNHIRAFEFINFLVKHGIKAQEISLVMPYYLANLQLGLMLNDSAIDLKMEEILIQIVEDMGVKVYDQMNLESIQLSPYGEYIDSVTFKRFVGDEKLSLRCDFFVSYLEKYMSDEHFEVFEAANLSMSGPYLLVDENYKTSNPCVYATGNYIKHIEEPNHQYRFVSPHEAAEKLVHSLDLHTDKFAKFEKKFSKPYYFQAHLPKDYYFFKITCPKRYLANHLNNEYGFPLTTYVSEDFVRVRLNEHGIVEEIVVVTKKNEDYDFLKKFCGRHELLLNNLRSRWFLKFTDNFLNFFQEPWVELLMNDNFHTLQKTMRDLIEPTAAEVMKLRKDRARRNRLMTSYCNGLGITSNLEYNVLKFLRDYREEFSSNIALPEDFEKEY